MCNSGAYDTVTSMQIVVLDNITNMMPVITNLNYRGFKYFYD